jgi:hypothetical protein
MWADPRKDNSRTRAETSPNPPPVFSALLVDRALKEPDDQLRTWAQEQLKLLEANP